MKISSPMASAAFASFVITKPYDDYQTYEEWEKEFDGYCGMGSAPSDRYYIPLPVWTGGNRYYNGAKPCVKEKDYTVDAEHAIRRYPLRWLPPTSHLWS